MFQINLNKFYIWNGELREFPNMCLGEDRGVQCILVLFSLFLLLRMTICPISTRVMILIPTEYEHGGHDDICFSHPRIIIY